MNRTLLLSLAVIGVAIALAVSSYSALAGSNPVSGVADAVVGADESDVGQPDADDAEEQDGAEGATEDAEASVQSEGETGQGAEHVAQVIADAFGVSQEEVLTHHADGIGFGALFKLYQLAQATGVSLDELLTSIQSGDDGDGYAFGKWFKGLTEEQWAVLESGPKNLGELVSASHHPDGDGDGAEAAAQGLKKANGKLASRSSHGHGPPAGVPANGHD